MKSRMSSKFGQNGKLFMELPVLESIKNPQRLIMGEILW